LGSAFIPLMALLVGLVWLLAENHFPAEIGPDDFEVRAS
jgi:hypothetical protein